MDRETIKRQIQLYHSDCLVGMERVESGSVDLILCDLPYGTTDCSWDTVIPFEPLWAQYRRVLKPRGAAVLMAAQPFATDLINSARNCSAMIWSGRNRLQWVLPTATGSPCGLMS